MTLRHSAGRWTHEAASGIVVAMRTQADDLRTSLSFGPPQRPRDAATLIIVRRDGPAPRVLLGKRHSGHQFMPNMHVFPGGRLEPDDWRMRSSADLSQIDLRRLQLRMGGRASPARARGLALAAVRETFEETGFIIGAPHADEPPAGGPGWASFIATGHVPDISRLTYFARAITPPGRTRRFDTRFFVAGADAVVNLERPAVPAVGELLQPNWFCFEDALALDLPFITRDILMRLRPVMDDLKGNHPVSFQYMKGKTWRLEML